MNVLYKHSIQMMDKVKDRVLKENSNVNSGFKTTSLVIILVKDHRLLKDKQDYPFARKKYDYAQLCPIQMVY